jgi:HSP20 family molecular chaperone IbpA
MSAVSVWTRRDPVFDALVRRAFGTPVTPGWQLASGFTPAAEVDRDGSDAVVRVELPGVDVDRDVTVEVDRGRLVIRGERRDERHERSEHRSVREVRYGGFQRSFTLPTHVGADAVSASYDAGVLSVRVAGAYAGSQSQRIAVTTGVPAVEQSPVEQPIEAQPTDQPTS